MSILTFVHVRQLLKTNSTWKWPLPWCLWLTWPSGKAQIFSSGSVLWSILLKSNFHLHTLPLFLPVWSIRHVALNCCSLLCVSISFFLLDFQRGRATSSFHSILLPLPPSSRTLPRAVASSCLLKCIGFIVTKYNNVTGGSPFLFTWFKAYVIPFLWKELLPITPVGWSGHSDSPLVQWMSDSVRPKLVRHDTARQDLDNTVFVLSSCPSLLLLEVHFYSLFPFLKHTT